MLRTFLEKIKKNQSTSAAIIITLIAVVVLATKLSHRLSNSDNEKEEQTWVQEAKNSAPKPIGFAAKVKLNEMETPPHQAPSAEIQKMSLNIDELTEETFKELTAKALAEIPLKNDLKNLKSSEEAHHFPEPVIKAGHQLGQIKEIIVKRPEFEEEAMNFYSSCASSDQAITSVRALCLTNLAKYKASHGEMIDMTKYPERVVELAQQGLNP